MLANQPISITDSLGISIACMMVVFAALLILFVCVSLFPRVFRQKMRVPDVPGEAAGAPAAGDDDGELLAVIAAAVRSYEQAKKKPAGIGMARNWNGTGA